MQCAKLEKKTFLRQNPWFERSEKYEMGNVKCEMGSEKWEVLNEEWEVLNEKWEVLNEKCEVLNGECEVGSVELWDEECGFVLSACSKTQWQAGQLRPPSPTTAPVTLDNSHHKRKKTNRQGGCRHPTLKQQGIAMPNQVHPPCGC